jgi:hypothetical protein
VFNLEPHEDEFHGTEDRAACREREIVFENVDFLTRNVLKLLGQEITAYMNWNWIVCHATPKHSRLLVLRSTRIRRKM